MAFLISVRLLLWCGLLAGIYLLLISLALYWFGRKLDISRGIAKDLLEETGGVWFMLNYLMESLFFVIIPAIAYGFFYLILPLSGVRAGMATAIAAIALGATPLVVSLSAQLKLPVAYLLYATLSHLLKLLGCLTIIGHLYSL